MLDMTAAMQMKQRFNVSDGGGILSNWAQRVRRGSHKTPPLTPIIQSVFYVIQFAALSSLLLQTSQYDLAIRTLTHRKSYSTRRHPHDHFCTPSKQIQRVLFTLLLHRVL